MATLKSIKNKYLDADDGTALGVTTNTENISSLSFKLATADSLSKFNMVDGFSDDYNDATGVDTSTSTGEFRTSDNYYSGSADGTATGGTVTTYTYNAVDYKVHTFLTGTNFVLDQGAGLVDALLIGGGGGGGGHAGTGGGAGGLLWETGITVGNGTHAVAVGLGGDGQPEGIGNSGADTTFNMGTTFTAIGGGYGTNHGAAPGAGGSGGGSCGARNDASGKALQPTSTDGGYGNIGGQSSSGPQVGHGGGGAGGAGQTYPGGTRGGPGGAGHNSFITSSAETAALLTAASIGVSGYLAGGGGGAGHQVGGQPNGGPGGSGGGGQGATGAGNAGGHGTANTGSGGGGGHYPNGSGGDGGKGVAVLRYVDGAFVALSNMTLQSNGFTAQAAPSTARIIVDELTSQGGTTLNTDLKAYASRDNGTTFTQMTLADQGYLNPNSGIDGYTKLMLHCDGSNAGTTFTDSSFTPHAVTASGNGVTSTVTRKFGTASYGCPATGDFLSIADSTDWAFGSDDFTIDCWLYRTGASSYQTILQHKTDNSNYWQWRYFGSGGNITFSITGTGAYTVSFGCTDSTFPVNTWVHHQMVRDGSSWYLFQNGTQTGSTQTQAGAIPDMTGNLIWQGDSSLGQPFVGYMDEMRISKGIARNVSNFAVPWGAYVNSRRLLSGSVDVSGQPSGTDMKYKVTTLNQAATKITRVYGTSMAWA